MSEGSSRKKDSPEEVKKVSFIVWRGGWTVEERREVSLDFRVWGGRRRDGRNINFSKGGQESVHKLDMGFGLI